MTFWLLLTVNSITFGGLLFLLSAGFSLIFGLMRIPNLTHGSMFMIGAYLGTSFLSGALGFTIDFWAAAIIAALEVAILGALMERVQATGLDVSLSVAGSPFPLGAAAERTAYRIVQEALTNTLRHAAALPGDRRVDRARLPAGDARVDVADIVGAAGGLDELSLVQDRDAALQLIVDDFLDRARQPLLDLRLVVPPVGDQVLQVGGTGQVAAVRGQDPVRAAPHGHPRLP